MKQMILRGSLERRILIIRGRKVMVDADLAAVYGVTTKSLNQAVKRNRSRFPADFMFQLTVTEKRQVVTYCDHLSQLKFSAALPFVFTEHGAIMLASILKSESAIDASILVVRAFVRLRETLVNHKEIELKITQLGQKYEMHDRQIQGIFQAIRQLMTPTKKKRYKVGF